MDLGLGNLNDLKRSLLPAAQQPETEFDQLLQEIGSGVAKAFEGMCNRKFKRVTGDVCEFSCDRTYYTLPRCPVEQITAIAIRETLADGWQAAVLDDVIENLSEASGIVEFGSLQGLHTCRLRITYTGGWWYDTDEEYGTAQPSGSTVVPGDVKHAWLLQCQHLLEQRDVLGARALGATKMEPAEIKLLPQVIDTLRPYTRFA